MDSVKIERLFEPPGPAPRRDGDNRVPYDERQARILQAATLVIARDGYEKASMRAIAKAAGVSLAGLYHYFQSKEAILFQIQFRTFSSLLAAVQARLHAVTDPVERLKTMIRAHVGYFASNMAALKVCSHELDSLSGASYEECRRVRRAYYDLARSILAEVIQAHAPQSPLDQHVAIMALFGTLNWLYRWYRPDRDRSPGGLANLFAAQFLNGILGAAPPR